MSREITPSEIFLLKRRHETEERIREFLHGLVGPRSAMWTGIHPKVSDLPHLVTLITAHMILLAEITTGRDWRQFGEACPWGNSDFHVFIDINETWEQNAARLDTWITRYEDWLESPLERMARAADVSTPPSVPGG